MNWLDIVVLLMLAVPTFIGFKRGLARTLLPLIAIISGIIVAGIFYGSMADWLSSWIESSIQANIAAFFIVFILFMLLAISLRSALNGLLGVFHFGLGGLTNTILPLVGIILGVALAGLFYGSVADLLSPWLESRSQATIVAFLIIFVLAMAASIELFLILSSLTGKTPRIPLMGWVDRLGGLIFGLAIGGIAAGAILSLIAKYSSPGMEITIKDSALAVFFLDQFPFVLHLLPNEFDTVRQLFG